MSVQCNVCCKAINVKERIFCFGGCGQVLHAKCADLTNAGELALRENLALKYMCHDCRKKQVCLNDMTEKCNSIMSVLDDVVNRLGKIESNFAKMDCDQYFKQCEEKMRKMVEKSAGAYGEQLRSIEKQITNSVNKNANKITSSAVGNGSIEEYDGNPSSSSFAEVVRRKKTNSGTDSILRSGRIRNTSVTGSNNSNDKNVRANALEEGREMNNSGISSNKKFGCSVRIKPAAQQSNHQTKKAVRSKINPAEIGVKSVRNGMNGAIVVDCGTESEAKGLVGIMREKFGEDYSADIEQPKRPRIKIMGVAGEYSSNELIDILNHQNDIGDVQFLKVLKCIPSKKNAEFSIICEVDASTFERIIRKGKLNIDFERCRVFESIEILRCFKCCGYGHRAGDCKNDVHCAKCAESHDVKDCSSEQESCVNCMYSNRERKSKFDTNHSSWSVDCPIYLKKVSISKSFINYRA